MFRSGRVTRILQWSEGLLRGPGRHSCKMYTLFFVLRFAISHAGIVVRTLTLMQALEEKE